MTRTIILTLNLAASLLNNCKKLSGNKLFKTNIYSIGEQRPMHDYSNEFEWYENLLIETIIIHIISKFKHKHS